MSKKGPIADWEVKRACPVTCIVILQYFQFRTWYVFIVGEIVLQKYSNCTGRLWGLIQKVPSLPKEVVPENRNLPPVCRGVFHFGNIQSSQNCFSTYFKMTVLTFVSFSCFLTFFSQKASIVRTFLGRLSEKSEKSFF